MPTKKKLLPVMRGDTWTIKVIISDVTTVLDGACLVSAPSKITSASAAFTAASVGKSIKLDGAGPSGADYSGRIVARDSATQVTVSPNISAGVAAKELAFGVPVDITDNVLWLTLKNNNDDVDPGVVQEKTPPLPANANSTAGIGFIVVGSDKTLVAPKTYSYDIQWIRPGTPPIVQTPVYGTIDVLEDTTRAVA